MGLLDFNPDLNDPKTQLLVSMGLGLLGGNPRTNKNFGADMAYAGMNGLGAYQNARQYQLEQQAMERQNRASDLQTAMGAYQFLRAQELPKMLSQGPAYQPPPELDQLQSRISQLINEGNLSGAKPNMAPVTGSGSANAAPATPGPAAPQPQPPSPPVGQNFMGANPNYQAPPQQPPAPKPTAQPALGGPAGGLPMQYWLMIDPTGKSYAEQLAKDNALISTRYGIFQPRRDAQGNITTAAPIGGALPSNAMPYGPPDASGSPTIAPLPGQLSTQSAVAEAGARGAEAGKFPGRVENVTLPSGATVPQLISQVVGNPYSGQPPTRPGAPQAPQPAVPPAVSAAAASGKPFEATQTPDGQVTVGQPKDPWVTAPKIMVPPGIGQTTYQAKLSDQRAATASKLADQYNSEAEVANTRIATNNQALDLVNNADTGAFANHIGQFRNLLATLGVSSATDKAATDQALQKDLVNTALQKGKQLFGSRFTQSEVGIMLSRANPSPEMQKVAIQFLLQTDNATQNYNIQRSQDFGRYIGENNDPLQFGGWYSKNFPLTNAVAQVLPPGKTQSIDDLVNKYRSR